MPPASPPSPARPRQVTELVVAQLLYVNYESPEKPVYMYINSVGTSLGNQIAAFETEAFAMADTMNYVAPDVETICLGTAYGTAAMLLANGAKGKRACLPNSSIMLHQPRSGARGQASDIAIKAREVLASRKVKVRLSSSVPTFASRTDRCRFRGCLHIRVRCLRLSATRTQPA